jgi:hypothetical protein
VYWVIDASKKLSTVRFRPRPVQFAPPMYAEEIKRNMAERSKSAIEKLLAGMQYQEPEEDDISVRSASSMSIYRARQFRPRQIGVDSDSPQAQEHWSRIYKDCQSVGTYWAKINAKCGGRVN